MTKFKDTTRGGHPATIYTTEAGGDRPIHGRIVIKSGEVMARDWRADGRYHHILGRSHPYDLLPLREPSEAAVEAAREEAARIGYGHPPDAGFVRKVLRAAYEIDFPEGAA